MILVRDGRDARYITALNIADGAEVWKTNRPAMDGGRTNMMKSFSTPAIVQHAGKTQMVIPGARWIVSYDPDTGKEHWRLKHGMGFFNSASSLFWTRDGVFLHRFFPAGNCWLSNWMERVMSLAAILPGKSQNGFLIYLLPLLSEMSSTGWRMPG